MKQIQEEVRSIVEAEKLCASFSDCLNCTQEKFVQVIDSSEPLDWLAMEKKMKKLEVRVQSVPVFS